MSDDLPALCLHQAINARASLQMATRARHVPQRQAAYQAIEK